MAAAVTTRAVTVAFGRLVSACSRSGLRASGPGAASLGSASRRFGSQSASVPQGYVPKTSLSSPPWPETVLPDPTEETRHHAELVGKVNELIATGQYGRLFAVVHFASHQWKVTSEDLILIDNELDVACGERIRLEKVLLVGADNFTLLGKPLLGKDLVRVEATVIEKTESWPKINVKFKKRKNFKRKKGKLEKVWRAPCPRLLRPLVLRLPGAGTCSLLGASGVRQPQTPGREPCPGPLGLMGKGRWRSVLTRGVEGEGPGILGRCHRTAAQPVTATRQAFTSPRPGTACPVRHGQGHRRRLHPC